MKTNERMKYMYSYSLRRVFDIFSFVVTVFLIILKQKRFLIFTPLPPDTLKKKIEKLGASFIKFAQVLATRADFFPPAYLTKLKELHDEIEPMANEDLQKVMEKAFHKKIPFESFDSKPIASASIGQVHVAYIDKDTKVAVKLRRLGIEKLVKADITIMKFLSRFLKPFFSTYTHNSIDSIIAEFSVMIMLEVDFEKELDNLQKFSTMYSNSGIIFPKPYVRYCSKDALVMSYEEGYRFNDIESLSKLNLDYESLMERLIIFYVDQMLLKGFFHADPHPGNLLINETGQLILLDFGMVKKIPTSIRTSMIELAKAANEYDFDTLISSCKKLGIIAYEAPMSQMQEFAETIFDILGNEHLSASSMQTLALETLESLKDFPFKLPQEIIYVIRASSIIEGLGTTHIENFNGVKDIIPILRAYIPKAIFHEEKLFQNIVSEINNLPFWLKRVRDIVFNLSEGTFNLNISQDQLMWIGKEVKLYVKGILLGTIVILIGIAIIVSNPSFMWLGWLSIIFGMIKIIYSL